MRRIGICLLACVVGLCLQTWGVEFNTDGDKEGWTTGNNLSSFDVKDGNMVIQIKANSSDPFLNGPAGSWDADSITGVQFRIRISADISGRGGPAMYFFPSAGQHGSYGYEILYPQEWNIVYIDFLSAPKGGDSPKSWEGEIGRIRIDFADNVPEDYTVEIDWIRFVDEHIRTNNFEYPGLDPWKLEGQGTLAAFRETTNDYFSEIAAIEVTGLGSDKYHALSQDIKDGLKLKKGQLVSVVGAVKVPKASWDANSEIWFRVREYDGTAENLSPPTPVSVFDEWFQFQSTLELKYEPANRKELKVQLYSKNPAGKTFFFDDIFVDIKAVPEKPIENPGWPVNAVKLAAGQKIAIDGNVSATEYKGAQAMVINSKTLAGIADPFFPQYTHNGKINVPAMLNTTEEDFSATYYFMWDNENFYGAVSAKDDNYSFVGPDPNGSDTLQFVFAETPSIQQTAMMYIPTIAPKGTDGNVVAKNAFGGWITTDIMGACEFAGKVDGNTSDWSVEIRMPWSAMKGDFARDVFPPKTGDMVGFAVLGIDYDDGALAWFGCNHSTYPWESSGIERIYFIDGQTEVSDWSLY